MHVVTQYDIRSLNVCYSLKDDKWNQKTECLDAPECLPMGGHRGFEGTVGRVIHSLGFNRDGW